jgi:hypothetical protein
MKFKLKALLVAGAIALGWGGQASAALTAATTGDSALTLFVWDTTATTNNFYVSGLGYNMSTFGPSTAPTSTLTYNLGADANLTGKFGSSLSTDGSVVWGITAGAYITSPANYSLAFTTDTQQTTLNGAQVFNFAKAWSNELSLVNSQLSGSLSGNTGSASTNATVSSNPATALNWDTQIASKESAFAEAGAVGSNLFFQFVHGNSTSGGTNFAVQNVGGSTGFWSLSSNEVLTWNPEQVSAVPVPAAAWLLGSGLMGLVGVGRRREKKAAIAA